MWNRITRYSGSGGCAKAHIMKLWAWRPRRDLFTTNIKRMQDSIKKIRDMDCHKFLFGPSVTRNSCASESLPLPSPTLTVWRSYNLSRFVHVLFQSASYCTKPAMVCFAIFQLCFLSLLGNSGLAMPAATCPHGNQPITTELFGKSVNVFDSCRRKRI